MADYVRAYTDRFAAVDSAYRGFESFLSDSTLDPESIPGLEELIEAARDSYMKAAETFQREFLAAVERESWSGPSFDGSSLRVQEQRGASHGVARADRLLHGRCPSV